MAEKGIKRYINLWKNIENAGEYIFHKNERHTRSLRFTTKPTPIHFEVPGSLYQVFKEIFMEDVYSIENLVNKLPANPVIVDIGANAGFFDILLLSKIKSAKILAFEPLASNTNFVDKVIAENAFMKQYISLYQAAVTGIEKESIDLYMEDTDDNQVVASVFEGFNKDNLKKTTVPCFSLTRIVKDNRLTKIDLLKMDCEGSEYDIIYNTAPEIVQLATHIAIEVHDVDDKTYNFASLKKYLESLSYSITSTPINNFCYAVDATRLS
jgi:FkbM family methyltransferase